MPYPSGKFLLMSTPMQLLPGMGTVFFRHSRSWLRVYSYPSGLARGTMCHWNWAMSFRPRPCRNHLFHWRFCSLRLLWPTGPETCISILRHFICTNNKAMAKMKFFTNFVSRFLPCALNICRRIATARYYTLLICLASFSMRKSVAAGEIHSRAWIPASMKITGSWKYGSMRVQQFSPNSVQHCSQTSLLHAVPGCCLS